MSRCRNRRGDETPPKQALPRDAQLGLNHRTFIDPNDETNRWQDEKAATAVAVLDRPGSRGPGPRRSCGLRAEPLWADEPADTPGSVPARGCPRAGGGHPSTTYVAARLQRPSPRTLPVWPCSGWGLPSRAGHPARWWSLAPPFHPYRSPEGVRRSVLCGTVPRVTPGGCCPPPCPAEPGRSSAGASTRRDRLAGSSASPRVAGPGRCRAPGADTLASATPGTFGRGCGPRRRRRSAPRRSGTAQGRSRCTTLWAPATMAA